jgi:hypothetical protein
MSTLVDDLTQAFGKRSGTDGAAFVDVNVDDLAAWLIARGVGSRGGRRRSRRERPEAPEVGQAARRFVRALVARAEEGDTEAIEQLVETQHETTQAITAAGQALSRAGYSYTDLARLLGVTRQAARQRFARRAAS